MDVYDFLGNVIKEGDMIVWPNRQGSSLWMNSGHVVQIGHEQLEGLRGVELVPVLQVDRMANPGMKTKRVEIYRTERVVALGRWDRFQPMKEPCEFRDMPKPFKETWLDRVMNWIRGN